MSLSKKTERDRGIQEFFNNAFLESTNYEDAIRNAISLGGDSDALACITGGIAEAYYGGVPEDIVHDSLKYLDKNQMKTVFSFYYKYGLALELPVTHKRSN